MIMQDKIAYGLGCRFIVFDFISGHYIKRKNIRFIQFTEPEQTSSR